MSDAVKIQMKTKDMRLVAVFIGMLLSRPLFASVIPDEAIYMIGVGVFLIAVALAFSISFVFNKLLHYTRKEEREHIWFMGIGTLVFPATYMLLEEQFHFVSHLEFDFSYDVFALAHILIIALLIFIGFHAGYFATVKKKEPEARTQKEKRRAIAIQAVVWLLTTVFFCLVAMQDQIKEIKLNNELQELTEKRTKVAMSHITAKLNAGFDEVHWNETNHTFSARTKEGLDVNLRYDSPSDYYYLSFLVKQKPVISDTLAWLEKLNIVKPLLSDIEYGDLMATVNRHEIRVNQMDEQNYYDISFSTANLAIVHYSDTYKMEILWVAATVVP